MKSENRIEYFDVAKGILIILLLFHHYFCVVEAWGGQGYPEFSYLKQTQIIFVAFFMQCFFFISGYCSSLKKPWKDFLVSQIRQIVIPMLTFGLIANLCRCAYPIFSNNFSFSLPILFGMSYWFFWALLISKTFIFLILKFTQKARYYLTIAFLLTVLGIVLKTYNIGNGFLYINHALGSTFIVAFGLWCRQSPDHYKRLMSLSAYIYPWLLLLLCLNHIRVPHFTAEIGVTRSDIPLFLATSLSGTLAFFYYLQHLKGKLNSVFIFFGKNSLIVYGVHFYFLSIFVMLFHKVFAPHDTCTNIVYFTAIYISEILCCTLWIFIFRLKFLRWLMGRKN